MPPTGERAAQPWDFPPGLSRGQWLRPASESRPGCGRGVVTLWHCDSGLGRAPGTAGLPSTPPLQHCPVFTPGVTLWPMNPSPLRPHCSPWLPQDHGGLAMWPLPLHSVSTLQRPAQSPSGAPPCTGAHLRVQARPPQVLPRRLENSRAGQAQRGPWMSLFCHTEALPAPRLRRRGQS